MRQILLFGLFLVAYVITWNYAASKIEEVVVADITDWKAQGIVCIEYNSLRAYGFPFPVGVELQQARLTTEIAGNPAIFRLDGTVHANRKQININGCLEADIGSGPNIYTVRLGSHEDITIVRDAVSGAWDLAGTIHRDSRESYVTPTGLREIAAEAARHTFPASDDVQSVAGSLRQKGPGHWTLTLTREASSSYELEHSSASNDGLQVELTAQGDLTFNLETAGKVSYSDLWRARWVHYLGFLWQTLPHDLPDVGIALEDAAALLIPPTGYEWKGTLNGSYNLDTRAMVLAVRNSTAQIGNFAFGLTADAELVTDQPQTARASASILLDGTDYRDLVDSVFVGARKVLMTYANGLPEEERHDLVGTSVGLRAYRVPCKELLPCVADNPGAPAEGMSFTFRYDGGAESSRLRIGEHTLSELLAQLERLTTLPREDL